MISLVHDSCPRYLARAGTSVAEVGGEVLSGAGDMRVCCQPEGLVLILGGGIWPRIEGTPEPGMA